MQWIMGLFVGIGLSATCGFRLFVPMLGLSLAAKFGGVPMAPGFHWMNSWLAIIVLSVATGVEVAGYYIPFIDNLLDTIATPAAAVAGTLVTASVIGGGSPTIQWSLAIIAGGGAATAIQTGTVLVRGTSSATTGGTGNFIVSTTELAASIVGTIISIVLPILAMIILAIFLFLIYRLMKKRKKRRQAYS